MTARQKQIPAGYMANAQGHLVPIDNIDEVDQLRDALVREKVAGARELQQRMAAWKAETLADIESFVALSAERYDIQMGGRRGNITLTSFDGQHKLQIAVADRLTFDERIQAAKLLVDECIHDWTTGSRSEIKALVEHAFQVDKEGRINLGRVLALTRLAIDDDRWKRAMSAVRDSMQVSTTVAYLRVLERVEGTDRYQQIALDLAAL